MGFGSKPHQGRGSELEPNRTYTPRTRWCNRAGRGAGTGALRGEPTTPKIPQRGLRHGRAEAMRAGEVHGNLKLVTEGMLHKGPNLLL